MGPIDYAMENIQHAAGQVVDWWNNDEPAALGSNYDNSGGGDYGQQWVPIDVGSLDEQNKMLNNGP